MGTVAVLEKGVGLDKTVRLCLLLYCPLSTTSSPFQLWRLPALLVDDFDEVIESVTYIHFVYSLSSHVLVGYPRTATHSVRGGALSGG